MLDRLTDMAGAAVFGAAEAIDTARDILRDETARTKVIAAAGLVALGTVVAIARRYEVPPFSGE